MNVGAIKPKSLVFTLELQIHTTSHIHTSKWNQSLLSKPRSCWREFKHLMYKCINTGGEDSQQLMCLSSFKTR